MGWSGGVIILVVMRSGLGAFAGAVHLELWPVVGLFGYERMSKSTSRREKHSRYLPHLSPPPDVRRQSWVRNHDVRVLPFRVILKAKSTHRFVHLARATRVGKDPAVATCAILRETLKERVNVRGQKIIRTAVSPELD